ncbi:MAG: NAD(P)/FAD-dependent oxidoreductase [Patescibacteria group bacterium]|nr:NAD(P)/FAD-dependent oxidoreductase [Patescibacteria group bacterium]
MQEKVLNNPKIEVKLDREIIDFLGEDRVSGIKMKDNKTGKEEVLDVRGIFLAIGHTPSTKFLSGSGVIMDKKGYIYTADRAGFESANELKEKFEPKFRFQTNIKGLFAAGDCMDSMYRQIGTAVGMGIAAEIEIEKYLEENKDKGFVEKIGEIAKKAVQCCID